MVWNADWQPFGSVAIGQSKLTSNIRFPGQYFDSETGLYYNYHRHYDPTTGRYIESDPIGLEGGLNTYGYVGADPLVATDEYGLTTDILSMFKAALASNKYVPTLALIDLMKKCHLDYGNFNFDNMAKDIEKNRFDTVVPPILSGR